MKDVLSIVIHLVSHLLSQSRFPGHRVYNRCLPCFPFRVSTCRIHNQCIQRDPSCRHTFQPDSLDSLCRGRGYPSTFLSGNSSNQQVDHGRLRSLCPLKMYPRGSRSILRVLSCRHTFQPGRMDNLRYFQEYPKTSRLGILYNPLLRHGRMRSLCPSKTYQLGRENSHFLRRFRVY